MRESLRVGATGEDVQRHHAGQGQADTDEVGGLQRPRSNGTPLAASPGCAVGFPALATTAGGENSHCHPRSFPDRRRHGPDGKGRLLLTSVAALTDVGGFLADWNRTHLFNPGWPPHARFHDAQTIALGSRGLHFLYRRGVDPHADVALGALLPSLFWVAQWASFAFPGAEGVEAEFPEVVLRVKCVWVSERFFSALMLALISAGYAAERRRRGA